MGNAVAAAGACAVRRTECDELSRYCREDVHLAVDAVELDHAVDEREERVIAAHADVRAGAETRAALANQDVAGDDASLPNFFTPRRLLTLSRPLRTLP